MDSVGFLIERKCYDILIESARFLLMNKPIVASKTVGILRP